MRGRGGGVGGGSGGAEYKRKRLQNESFFVLFLHFFFLIKSQMEVIKLIKLSQLGNI